MTIVAGDLKLFASLFPLDVSYGGGRMAATVVQDGTENNLFPDIAAAARASGRVQMRKTFAAVVSANADVLSGAEIYLSAAPSDAAVHVVAFTYGDQNTTRGQAANAISAPLGTALPRVPDPAAFPYVIASYGATTTRIDTDFYTSNGVGSITLPLGALVALTQGSPSAVVQYNVMLSSTGTAPNRVVTWLKPLLSGTFGINLASTNPTAPRACGRVLTTATSTSNGAAVAAVEARIVPNTTVYPTTVEGIDPAGLALLDGKVPIFRPGDTVVVTDGTNTETALVSVVDYRGTLTFAANLAHSYASGSKVSSLVQLGDMGASIGASFSQQTWTKVFRDSLIGAGISANYDRTAGVITTSNLGAETERWAIVFTSTTAFKLIGENAGQIATGSTASNFSPVNPITSTPYFTIPSAGWGSGWAIGNVLRFNTLGARAPLWVLRTIDPSSPGGTDGSTWKFRGTIDA